MRRSIWLLVLSLMVVQGAWAELGTTSLKELVRNSQAIALVHVDEIVRSGYFRVAKATVVRPFYNLQPGEKVAFRASINCLCDASSAVMNRNSLALL